MSLMRPLTSPLMSIQGEFDRLFRDLERQLLAPMWSSGRTDNAMDNMMTMWSPPIDIVEKEKEVVITASVPGLRPEDIKVEVEGNKLTISGETRQDKEDKDQNYYHREIVQGKFFRQVELPFEPDSDGIARINARFENGLLMVPIPRPKSQQTRRHEIKINR